MYGIPTSQRQLNFAEPGNVWGGWVDQAVQSRMVLAADWLVCQT